MSSLTCNRQSRHSLCRVGRVVHTSAAIDDADLLVSSRLLGRQTCKVASGSSGPVELRVDKVAVRLVDVPDGLPDDLKRAVGAISTQSENEISAGGERLTSGSRRRDSSVTRE